MRLTYTSTFQQVSDMEAFVDLKVAGGDLLEGPGIYIYMTLIYIYNLYKSHVNMLYKMACKAPHPIFS